MDDGRQLLAWTQVLPWDLVADGLAWQHAWMDVVDDVRRRFLEVAAGRPLGPTMNVEVEQVWWLDDWDDEDGHGSLFTEHAVRVTVGPVIGPLPAPRALHARFSTLVGAAPELDHQCPQGSHHR